MTETNGNNVKDLTLNRKVQTVVEIMSTVGEEIEAIKAGSMDAKTGALVMRGRGLQFRGVELYLQAARLDHSMRKDLHTTIGSPAVAAVVNVEEVK